MSSRRTEFRTTNYALVMCRHPVTLKWLAVDESRARGWWLPGGAVDAGETFPQAALRECMEEAGVKVVLRGIIGQDYQLFGTDRARMRVIYFAEPADPKNCVPKQEADAESNGARWVTLNEFRAFKKIRSSEMEQYASYVEGGGQVFPLELFQIDPGAWTGDVTPHNCRAFQVVPTATGADATREAADAAEETGRKAAKPVPNGLKRCKNTPSSTAGGGDADAGSAADTVDCVDGAVGV